MRNLNQVKSINDIKKIIMAENEKSSISEGYLPSTELVLLTNEELKLLSLNASGEHSEYSTGNQKSNDNNRVEHSRHHVLLENVIDLENNIYSYFLLISKSIGYKVNENVKNKRNTKQIVKELTSKLNDKCRYFINDGALNFEIIGGQSELESNEAMILVAFGAFACLRINLEYLELRNPELKGMNDILKILYPEAKEAYEFVSKKFGFNKTVYIGFKHDSPEELLEHMKAMKLESWNQGNISNHYLSNNGHLN